MIARTYGRRSESMRRKFAESFSQESAQDVYDFTLSSQGSTRWSSDPYAFNDSSDPYAFNDSSDPYGLNNLSSQEGDELTILPSRGVTGNGDLEGFGGALWKSSKKVKIGDLKPYTLNSSPDSDELTILSTKKGGEDGDFRHPDGIFGRARDSEPYWMNSSQESDELAILPVKKGKENGKIEGGIRKSKKVKNNGILLKKNKKKVKIREEASNLVSIGPTATLMETQEFGEMMEHVDEVDFALDGLKKGQPVRVRRGSLISLLSICATASQRRMLRAHGMAKTIVDAVMGLSFDDSPSNVAAAALFYVLTIDGYDDCLLELPSYIRFLMKLLRPLSSDTSKMKKSTFGSKLLAIRKDHDNLQTSAKGSEISSTIMMKVHEVLVSCKDLKPRDGNDRSTEIPELNPKWISLLTMEKACLSTVSIEDTSGRVRRTGAKFKEKLRELGGLDAVFEVARSCHSIMEGWLDRSPSSVLDYMDKEGLESVVLLLKCLKIMENATFLSNGIQSHLLGMKGNFDSQKAPRSSTKLILSVIKILSGISLLRSSLASSEGETCTNSNEASHLSDHKVKDNGIECTTSSTHCCSLQGSSSVESLDSSQDSQRLTFGYPGTSKSSSSTPSMSIIEPWLKMRIDSSTSGLSSGKSGEACDGAAKLKSSEVNFGRRNNCKVLDGRNSEPMDDSRDPFAFDDGDFETSGLSSGKSGETCDGAAKLKSSKVNFGRRNNCKVLDGRNSEPMDNSQDPFAFDDGDFEPSKWEILSGIIGQRTHNTSATARLGDGEKDSEHHLLSDKEELQKENFNSSEVSCSSTIENEKFNLLADCLLSAVKVLVNLTNDNPVGCQQIAVSGGLEILSSLIANHYPNFCSYLPPSGSSKESGVTSSSAEAEHKNDRHLTDQELDLLVAILGLLVNLVEKDSVNRTRLAGVRVPLPNLAGLEEDSHTDLVPLLCSIFLANQGVGEAAAEGKCLSWDDEDALRQGEKEAEKMILEAYAALLLAFLSTERRTRKAIAECLPNHNIAVLVPVLERFVEFHFSLDMITPETHSTVLEVIESCRIP